MRVSTGQGLLGILAFFTGHALSLSTVEPAFQLHSDGINEISANNTYHRHSKRAVEFYLRILPLGASIVEGQGSSTNNGFRKPLRDQLRAAGFKVNMVGSKKRGSMVDNDFEAVRGSKVDKVRELAKNSYGHKPNLILINAGTNDCVAQDTSGTKDEMGGLLDDLFKEIPDTTIILSTVLASNREDDIEKHRPGLNNDYRELVKERRAQNQKVVLADMDYITKDDLAEGDDIHPGDEGFAKMAAIWWKAIQVAMDEDLITAPAESDVVTDGTYNMCPKKYGSGRPAEGTQQGSGEDDGIYKHTSEKVDKRMVITTSGKADFFFARMRLDKTDDLVRWEKNKKGEVQYHFYQNDGNGHWDTFGDKQVTFTVHDNCEGSPAGVRWADMNGDGLDDFVCIGTDGDLYVAINQGGVGRNKGPSFKHVGTYKTREGFKQDRIHLADIDGDGRFDYCALVDNGDIKCWRNGGLGEKADYWQAMGTVFTSKGKGDYHGVRFADVNGDGRTDWLWLNDQGQTSIYTNNRGCEKGTQGDGLKPLWREAENMNNGKGPTHPGVGVDGARANIHFARATGVVQDFGLHMVSDYIWIEDKAYGVDQHEYTFHVWKNLGRGGTKLKADGARYCNMLGHENGAMDYVWALSRGRLTLYPNDVPGGPEKAPHWGSPHVIFNPPENQGRSLDRRDLHLADWNGDGFCDVIYVKPDTGKVEVWINRLNKTANDFNFNWRHLPDPAPTLSCNQKRGHGIFDLAVRFADLTGNGRADYLCMEKDGRTTGFVHNDGGSWESVDQIKFSVGMDRANHRWADVNGDGKADFLWVEKFSGDTSVWLNQGRRDGKGADGSSFQWDQAGVLYRGAAQGSCYHFPDLDGNKRADFHLTYSDTNKADTSFNDCPDNGGDDDKTLTDPGLPIPPSDRWRGVSCTDKYVNDSSAPGDKRWRAADSDGAWEALVRYYHDPKNKFAWFSQYVGGFFKTTDDRRCGLLGTGDNCITLVCNEDAHSAPASFLITNSLVEYHNIFTRLREGLKGGGDKVKDDLAKLEEHFAPGLSDDKDKLFQMLNLIGLAFGLASGPVFNNVLKSTLSSGARDNIKDLSVNAVSWGVTIAKDEYSQAKLGGNLQSTLSHMTRGLQNTTVKLAQRVFLAEEYKAGNKEEDLKNLFATISQGKMLNATKAPTDIIDLETAVAKSLTVFMIGNAWRMGVQEHHPVLLTTDAKCDAPHEGEKDVVAKQDLEASATCVDGRRYYLMSAKGEACRERQSNSKCLWRQFQKLPGIENLGNDDLYYGLTLNDFARGALNNFKRYGNRPTAEQQKSPDKETIRSFLDMNFGGAGSVPIEVCSRQEALDWWRSDENKMKSVREFSCPEKL